MAEHKSKFFKTAEQKHKEKVILKCKICGKKMQGKTTLSRHISHAHGEMEPVDREKIVIDTYYGKDKVDKIIRQVKDGVYKNKAVPIDIGRYLRLAGIKWEHDEEKKKHETPEYKTKEKKTDYGSEKLLVKIVDLADEESHDKKIDEIVFYLDDILVDEEDSEKLILTKTKGKTSSLSYEQVLEFIEENDLKDGILFVSTSEDELQPVVSIDVKKDDEVTGNQIKCVVAYDSTKDKKEK